jgi:hypothetical protein
MAATASLPQARIPLGWAMVNGQRVPVEIDALRLQLDNLTARVQLLEAAP